MSDVKTNPTEVLSAIPEIWDRIIDTRKNIINRDGFLYACYYEINLNLSIISSLQDKYNKNESKNSEQNTNEENLKIIKSEEFKKLINCLKTEALFALLVGSDRRSYRRLIIYLKNNDEVKIEKETDEKTEFVPKYLRNTLNAINFIVYKIETLRCLINIKDADKELLREIKIDVRIRNIYNALMSVQKTFETMIRTKENAIRYNPFVQLSYLWWNIINGFVRWAEKRKSKKDKTTESAKNTEKTADNTFA